MLKEYSRYLYWVKKYCKVNFTCFLLLLNVATRKFYLVDITLLLKSIAVESRI